MAAVGAELLRLSPGSCWCLLLSLAAALGQLPAALGSGDQVAENCNKSECSVSDESKGNVTHQTVKMWKLQDMVKEGKCRGEQGCRTNVNISKIEKNKVKQEGTADSASGSYGLCDWCPAVLRNSSEVARFCQTNHLVLRGRCCLSAQEDRDTIVGLDLWNCSLSHLGSEIQNASAAVVVDISGNPLQNLSASLFQGFASLQYIALPPAFPCPGGNASWESMETDANRTVCEHQRSTCNGTGELTFLCPENSLCSPDGPGLFKCLCAEDFHGYKCLREGTFPYFMFFGILGAVTVACSLLLWCSQRRKVKNS